MGKITGFMEYKRLAEAAEDKRERVKHYREFFGSVERLRLRSGVEVWASFKAVEVELLPP